MTDLELQLLSELEYGIISKEIFLKNFPIDLNNNPQYIEREVLDAVQMEDGDNLELALNLIWLFDDLSHMTHLLNLLIVTPNHISHQRIAQELQKIKSSTTVPYVRQALAKGFNYLEYTCSDSRAITKWFSWILFAIGTKEAVELMREYSSSSDEGVKAEMLYRLGKVNHGP